MAMSKALSHPPEDVDMLRTGARRESMRRSSHLHLAEAETRLEGGCIAAEKREAANEKGFYAIMKMRSAGGEEQ